MRLGECNKKFSFYQDKRHYIKGTRMNKKVENHGLKPVPRPKIPATKRLDLSGATGQQIIKSETKLVLRIHAQTFKKLEDM